VDVVLLVLRVLLAALLYAFLVALFLLLWRDLRRTAGGRAVAPPKGRLVLVEPGETSLEAGVAFSLQEVTSIGRTLANIVVLPDPFVSTHHALLAWREARWWLEDLESKNGTTLNSEPVTRPTVVSAGDLIGVGRVVLRLEVEG
jgi:hypothetical protein